MNNLIQKVLTCIFVALTLLFGFVSVPVQADDKLIVGEIYGNPSASCSLRNSSGSMRSTSGSSTCYVDVEKAVDYILIYCNGGASSNCSRGSGSWTASASFNGVTGSPSGGVIRLNIGSAPVSGTLTVTLSCSAQLSCSDGDSASAWCSVDSVKYKTVSTPSFNSNSTDVMTGVKGSPFVYQPKATFPDINDGENSYKWYMYVDSGLKADGINSNYTDADADTLPDDSSSGTMTKGWVPISGDSSALEDESVYHALLTSIYDIAKGGESSDKNNALYFENSDAARGTLNIVNLTLGAQSGEAENKSLDGAFFKVVAHNGAGDSEEHYMRLHIKNSEFFYKGDQGDIIWKYGLDNKGQIVTLFTEQADLSSIIDSNGTLHVPAMIDGMIVRGIGSGNGNHPFVPISQVTEGVTTKDRTAFTSIEIPETVEDITAYAFAGIESNAGADAGFSVTIPSNVRTVGEKAFYSSEIDSLTSFAKVLGPRAFGDCQKLESVTINCPDGRAQVQNACFEKCTALKSLEFNSPGSEIELAQQAFLDTGLEELYLPSYVTVGNEAFACSDASTVKDTLKRVQISYDNVEEDTFKNRTGIKHVIFDESVKDVRANWAPDMTAAQIFVKGNTTVFHADSANTKTCFGNGGDVDVYYVATPSDKTELSSTEPSGVITAIHLDYNGGKDDGTLDAASTAGAVFKGNNAKITFHNSGSEFTKDEATGKYSTTDTMTPEQKAAKLAQLGETYKGLDNSLKDFLRDVDPAGQTGIYAESKRTLLVDENRPDTLKNIDVVVRKVGGGDSGQKLSTSDYWIFLDNDSHIASNGTLNNVNLSSAPEGSDKASKVIEVLGSKKDITVHLSDLKNNESVILQGYAVQPSNASDEGYFIAPFDITVTKYSPENLALREYKTYSEIIKAAGELTDKIDKAEADLERIKGLLANIKDLTAGLEADNDGKLTNASKSALADQLETANTEYEKLSDEEKASDEGKALKGTIDAITLLLNDDDAVSELEQEIEDKEQELDDLEKERSTLVKALSDFIESLEGYNGLFSYARKDKDGNLVGYRVFINGNEYEYNPSEDKNDYIPEGDLLSHPLHTVHVNKDIDPEATDLDNKDDGVFKYYAIGSTAYVINDGAKESEFKKTKEDYKTEATAILTAQNDRIIDLTSGLKSVKKEFDETMSALEKAGYKVKADTGKESHKEVMEAIKEQVIDLIGDYDHIKEMITGDSSLTPEQLEEMLKGYNDKITNLEDAIKDALGKDPDYDANLLKLLQDIQTARVNWENSTDEELRKQIEDLQKALDAANAKLKNLNNNNGKYSDDYVNGLLSDISKLQDELTKLKNSGASSQTTSELQKQLDEITKQLALLQESNDALKARSSTLESSLTQIKSLAKGEKGDRGEKGDKGDTGAAGAAAATPAAATTGGGYSGGGGGTTRTVTTPATGTTNTTTEKEKTTSVTQKDKDAAENWEYKDNKDGTHTKKNKVTAESITENHKYDEFTGKCVCGAEKKDEKTVNIKQVVDQSTCKHEFEWVDNKNGTHTGTCKTCKLVKTEKHHFDDKDGICTECGAIDDTKKTEEKVEDTPALTPSWANSSKTAEVSTIEPVEGEDLEEEEEKGGVPVGMIILIVLLLGGAGFCVYYFLLKDKLGKKAKDDDEDDDEDEFISSDEEELNDLENPEEDDFFGNNEEESDPFSSSSEDDSDSLDFG